MTTCREITELATDHAEGHLDATARAGFEAHLAACAHCRAYVRQYEATVRAIAALPEPEVPPELTDSLLRRFNAWVENRSDASRVVEAAPATEALPALETARLGNAPAAEGAGVERRGWRALFPTLAALGALVALVAFARDRSRSPQDWGVAAALAIAALALASLASRFALSVVAAAVSAAVAAALATGGAGGLDLVNGLECLATELAMAAAVAAMAWLVARPVPGAAARRVLGAGAAAGALAGYAALQVTCGAHDALAHLLAFHVGGVVATAAGALFILLWQPRPAST